MTANTILDQDYIQYGFAGFCIVLIGLVVWMIKQLIDTDRESRTQLVDVIEKNNSVLAKLIDVLKAHEKREELHLTELSKYRTAVDSLKVELAKRPCLRDHIS